MKPGQIREFLEKERTLVLATNKTDGAPVMHAMWFTYLDDAVYLDMKAGSFKHRNIQRDNRVCCLVEAGETYFQLRGVMIEGRATIVEGSDEQRRVRDAADAKSDRIGSGLEEMPAYFSKDRRERLDRGDRIMVRVPLDRVRTWDFGSVREHYDGAAGGTDREGTP